MSDEIHAGGGGSGYIGNSDTTNGCMRGYDAQTSSDAGTLTRKATGVSRTAISNQAKMMNGFCRITYLGPTSSPSSTNYMFYPDMTTDGHDTVRYYPSDTFEFEDDYDDMGVGCTGQMLPSSYSEDSSQSFVSNALVTGLSGSSAYRGYYWQYSSNYDHEQIFNANGIVKIGMTLTGENCNVMMTLRATGGSEWSGPWDAYHFYFCWNDNDYYSNHYVSVATTDTTQDYVDSEKSTPTSANNTRMEYWVYLEDGLVTKYDFYVDDVLYNTFTEPSPYRWFNVNTLNSLYINTVNLNVYNHTVSTSHSVTIQDLSITYT